MKINPSLLREFAIGVAMRAGTILMRNFNDSFRLQPVKKNKDEFVTKSDKEVHKFMRLKIREQFPTHNFISEEGGCAKCPSEYTWIIDPLDGTLNYMIRNPFFSTSIALLKNNEPILGIIYAPFNREMFVAVKGQPARLNERNIYVSKQRRLANSVLVYSFFPKNKKSRQVSREALKSLEDKSRALRHLGCTSLELAYIACGRMEAQIIVPPLRIWDVVAGMLLVECAEGQVSNFCGQKWEGIKDGLIASNKFIHSQILNLLRCHRF